MQYNSFSLYYTFRLERIIILWRNDVISRDLYLTSTPTENLSYIFTSRLCVDATGCPWMCITFFMYFLCSPKLCYILPTHTCYVHLSIMWIPGLHQVPSKQHRYSVHTQDCLGQLKLTQINLRRAVILKLLKVDPGWPESLWSLEYEAYTCVLQVDQRPKAFSWCPRTSWTEAKWY